MRLPGFFDFNKNTRLRQAGAMATEKNLSKGSTRHVRMAGKRAPRRDVGIPLDRQFTLGTVRGRAATVRRGSVADTERGTWCEW